MLKCVINFMSINEYLYIMVLFKDINEFKVFWLGVLFFLVFGVSALRIFCRYSMM